MKLVGRKLFNFKKIIVILLGIVFSLLVLELVLRLGGFLFVSFQEHNNRISLNKKDTYRIICLGESTTAGQYSSFLEQDLNRKNIGIKFSVIDKGVILTDTTSILLKLKENLNKYKPDMVIAMMGSNDTKVMYYKNISEINRKLFRNCRIYRFIRLIYMHLLNKLKKESVRELGMAEEDSEGQDKLKTKEIDNVKNLSSVKEVSNKTVELNTEKDNEYVKLGWFYRSQNNLIKAEEAFKKAAELNPKNGEAYFGMGFLYQRIGKLVEAEEALKKAIEINPRNSGAYSDLGELWRCNGKFSEAKEALNKAIEINPRNGGAHVRLGQVYQNEGKFSEAEEEFKKAIAISPKNKWPNLALAGLYWKQGKLSQIEKLLKDLLLINPKSEWAYGALENLYIEMNEIALAEEYKKKKDDLKINEYSPITINNYLKLKEILDKKNIQLVCAQYPMRSIEPLKKIFEKERGMIFVDNESTFKEAIKRDGYTVYFVDLFAGDFGHCTSKGNWLLAKNIANVILKEVFKKTNSR